MKEIKNSFMTFRWVEFKDHIYIELLEIEPEFRNKGYGTRIMKDFLEQHKGIPIRMTVLDEDAARFWERLGFKKKGLYYAINGGNVNVAQYDSIY